MNDWTEHPRMKQMDPLKQELIRAAARQVQGKSGSQMASVMMALITSARNHNVQFSPDEMSLIMDILKDGKSPAQQQQLDHMVSMVMQLIRQNS